MSHIIRFVTKLHRVLLCTYPQSFLLEFGEEASLTFEDAVDDSMAKGGFALFKLGLRELWDFPAAVLSAYWLALQERNGRNTMFNLKQEKNWKIADPRDARIAALPPLIFGLGFALGILIIHEPWQQVPAWRMWLGIGVIALGGMVLAVGALRALWQRIPDWGYSWIGFAYIGLMLFIKTLAEEQADFGLPMVSPIVDQIIVVVILLGFVAFLGIAVLRGWQQAGLLSLGFAGMMGISIFGMLTAAPVQRLDLALFIIPVSVVMALLVYLYCGASDAQRIWVLLAFILLYGVTLWLVFYAWQGWHQAHGGGAPFVPLFVIFLILLLSGPVGGILGTPLRRILHKSQ